MKRAILTGFEPFGPYGFNPVQDIAVEYDGLRLGDIEITGLVLPCSYFGAFGVLSKNIDSLSPDIILSTGLASRVRRVRFEAYGRNLMNGKYPDSNGYMPVNEPVVDGGKPSYRTNTDSAALANSLHDAGIPSEVSVDAEGFICNSLLYLTARRICEEGLPIRYAFFHAPWTDDYLGRVEIGEGKIVIGKGDLRKAVETTMRNIFP